MVLDGTDAPRPSSPGTALAQTLPVGVGLLVLGLTAYGFLVVSARALGPHQYGSLSALWALVFLAGPGFFLPLEQEVGRSLAARRAVGEGDGSLLRRAAVLGGLLGAVLVATVLAFRSPLLAELFDDQTLLLVGLVLALAGYFAEHLVRGSLAGSGRFRPYGVVLGAEGTLRLVGCLVLAVAGVSTAGPYGVVLGGAPLLAAAAGMRRTRAVSGSGPPAPYRTLTASLGWLLAASLSAQLLVNAGPLAVKSLASDADQAVAGRFLAGLVLAHIPLFLFQAVQASLLPRLSELDATGRHADLRSGLRRLVLVVVGIALVSVTGAATIGPRLLEVLFGADFRLGHRDLVLLAGANGAYLLALTLAQPLIALSSPARVAVGWMTGVGVFVVTTAVMNGLLVRVETGFLLGSLAAAGTMGALLVPLLGESRLRQPHDHFELPGPVPTEP